MSVGGGGGGTPPPGPEEHALAERGAREFNDFLERGIPLSRKFIELTQDPTRGARMAGKANADVASAFAGDAAAGVGAALSSGEGLDSGAALMALTMPGLKQTSAYGTASGRAYQLARNQKLAGLQKMSAYGRGLSDHSSMGLRSAGADSTRQAIADAEAKTQEYVAGLDAIGKVGGFVGGRAISELEAEKAYKGMQAGRAGQPIKPPTPTLDFFRRL